MRATLPFILRPAAATLLILGVPALHALEAPRPVPDVGVTHEYSGRLLGVDCPAWTVTAVTPDGGTRAECQRKRLTWTLCSFATSPLTNRRVHSGIENTRKAGPCMAAAWMN